MSLPIDLKLLKDENVAYSIIYYVPSANPNNALGAKNIFWMSKINDSVPTEETECNGPWKAFFFFL